MIRLAPRLRTESAPASMRWTWSQLTTLGRIAEKDPRRSALCRLRARTSSVDGRDGRLLASGRLVAASQTPQTAARHRVGHIRWAQAHLDHRPRGKAWLEAAIEQNLTPAERRTLLKAADIMERLADC